MRSAVEKATSASSASAAHSALPHPRLYGTYPYAFRRFVASGAMSEVEFVERTAARPSQMLHLERYGRIEEGAEADLVVVDPATFGHRADYLEPWNPVTGLEVLVLGGELQELGGSPARDVEP